MHRGYCDKSSREITSYWNLVVRQCTVTAQWVLNRPPRDSPRLVQTARTWAPMPIARTSYDAKARDGPLRVHVPAAEELRRAVPSRAHIPARRPSLPGGRRGRGGLRFPLRVPLFFGEVSYFWEGSSMLFHRPRPHFTVEIWRSANTQ